MVNIPRQAPGTTTMSYSASSTSTSASASPSAPGPASNSSPSTPSSSLYLFTFLITIVVLGVISGGLLFRAYYMRRQFHRRVEEAIRTGRPIPTEAAHALGLGGFTSVTGGAGRRNKKDKKVGPMPSLWEVEMLRDGEKWDRDDESGVKDWDELTPLSISHYTTIETTNPDNTNLTQLYLPPAPPSPTNYIRSLLTSHRRADIYNIGNTITRPGLPRTGTAQSIPQARSAAAAYTIPEEGDDVVVGVMIAMPVQGSAEERWNLDLNTNGQEDDEREVPEVCLGVMSTRIAKNKYSESDE